LAAAALAARTDFSSPPSLHQLKEKAWQAGLATPLSFCGFRALPKDAPSLYGDDHALAHGLGRRVGLLTRAAVVPLGSE
jgi:hypothetical protein